MSKLAIIATAEIAPGKMDEVLPLFMAHWERCLKGEPGTLQFEVLVPRDGENKVLIYEVYRDDEAFKAHWEGPSMARVRTETQGMVVNMSGTRCNLQE